MKKIILLGCLLVFCGRVWAQREVIDSLTRLLSYARADSAKAQIMIELLDEYPEYNADSGIYYGNRFYLAGKKTNNQDLINHASAAFAFSYYIKGDFAVALDNGFHLLRIIENGRNTQFIANTYNMIGNIYKGQQNYPRALTYYLLCKQKANLCGDTTDLTYSYFNIALVYDLRNIPDSAIIYAKKALAFAPQIDNGLETPAVLAILGHAYAQLGNNKTAYSYLRRAYAQTQNKNSYKRNSSIVCVKLSQYFKGVGKRDSAIYYACKALSYAKVVNFKNYEYISAKLLSSLYENGHSIDSAYKYLKFSSAVNDSLYNAQGMQESEALTATEEGRLKEIEQAKATYRNDIKIFLLISSLVIVFVIVGLLWRNNREKQKANYLLSEQKEEIASQRDDLGRALEALKTTQTQLIQSEKMASLGELTAGIAHEIQNPLNFVNNFSEVNKEMVAELEEELHSGNIEEALAIAADIKQNEEKINHHGKRADFIVKGMLEHSRTSTGEKQLTDLNVLCDEFMKLSYYGLRAKDKDFNAVPIAIGMITHFDTGLPSINIVPQDISRVMLNLFNNAFYAVNEKQKMADADYKPTVSVTTMAPPLGGRGVVIIVKDNGNGIRDAIKDKIMQPFFTTKPTGEGTGLGLSLSYDIVVKGHGGSITVDTKEGAFAAFTITLPI